MNRTILLLLLLIWWALLGSGLTYILLLLINKCINDLRHVLDEGDCELDECQGVKVPKPIEPSDGT